MSSSTGTSGGTSTDTGTTVTAQTIIDKMKETFESITFEF